MSEKLVNNYISSFNPEVSEILKKVRSLILNLDTNLIEVISYGIPTYNINNTHVIHFAAFKNHFSIFPTPLVIDVFKEKLKNYKISKGTIQFQFNNIDYDLIKEIAIYRINKVKKNS